MKSCFLIIALFFTISIAMGQSSIKSYAPKYADKWHLVADTILAQWAYQKGQSKGLPHTYISAWPGLPFMFYWDTYFINEGLLLTDIDSFAVNNTKNLLYAVDKFGYVGNAFVTTWGMNRSQPPYLSEMVKKCYEKYGVRDTTFLKQAYHTLLKEYFFWTDTSLTALQPHKTSVNGLQRYSHSATKPELVELYKELAGRFNLLVNVNDSIKINTAIPFAIEAGTGMDFTTRFQHRCQDFIAVDLNSLLYGYEKNFAWMVSVLQLSGQPDWNAASIKRKKLLNKYCWNKQRGLFLDYDFANQRYGSVAAITAFQPVWTGMASQQQVKRLIKQLPLFETEWGLITTEVTGEIKNYQWGETSVWAPMQLMVAQALDKYGYNKLARRIAARYLDLVTKNFLNPLPLTVKKNSDQINRKPGKLYEKYKKDGTINDDEYVASEMMGWTAGAFLWCYNYLKQKNK
jgi:alpha,alpha-trehalase